MRRRVSKRIIPFAYYVHIQEAIRSHSLHKTTVLFVVSKVFEKIVNDKTNGDLGKCGLFSDFQYGFRSSQSTSDLLTVVSDRIAKAFNIYGATRVVSKAFDSVWHAGLLHKLKYYGISGQIFGLISSFYQ